MSECACIWIDRDDDFPEVHNEKIVSARKQHKCAECGAPIEIGQKYEYVFGVWEGEPDTFKTCLDCVSARTEFFCDGWPYGQVWDYIRNHIAYLEGQVSSDCILPLTPIARDRVFDLIHAAWDRLDDFLGE